MTDKSDVLTGPKNTMPSQDRNNRKKAKNLTTKEIQVGPPDVSQAPREIESPNKVFDTSGMEAALTQITTAQLQDSTDNTNTDDQTGTFVSPNGTPVSSSLGTARTAFIKAGGRKHTLQNDKESSTTTYS